ncbi:DUF3046 domain-containing protein [uncultured Tessaracoccus sp.]|uniref:DUF3046 domain-containing protein n=1 Tax=uncultured Tessaracoccus sp. TaxID=905023 RepID=UPI0025E391E7|nr:DUF3046 domain-containing protein [uncultured Tessaracoccus sp.]
MREVELWARLCEALGDDYAPVWAENTVLQALGSRTVQQAIDDGLPSKRIWLAVWEQLELPERDR